MFFKALMAKAKDHPHPNPILDNHTSGAVLQPANHAPPALPIHLILITKTIPASDLNVQHAVAE